MSDSNTSKPNPTVLLEINEVPWRVIDLFCSYPEYPNIKKFFEKSTQITTLSKDAGELSPWVTWPSFHRGMNNTDHKVKNLGQDPESFLGKPIWDEFIEKGHPVGVCGSMQSWPPKDPGQGGFYIPDTFAADEKCIPAKIEVFQKFNLSQVQSSGRVVDGGFSKSEALKLLMKFPSLGIRFKTCFALAKQLLMERFDKTYVSRRPVFQGILCWDIFVKHYNVKNPPAFATFFTNHVAGLMHRYWDNIFPEDFNKSHARENSPLWPTICFAMTFLDQLLGEAMEIQKRSGCNLIFASSMGQAMVDRDYHEGFETVIRDKDKLMQALGFSKSDYREKLAMVPQIAFGMASQAKRDELVEKLHSIKTSDSKQLFYADPIGDSVTITVDTRRKNETLEPLVMNGSQQVQWDDFGLEHVQVTPGTAYHIPEGSFALIGPAQDNLPLSDRETLPLPEVKSFILNNISQLS